ncbi:MAG: hypothetical protein Tsb0033_21690 [Winogradskyella sp.]
MVPVITLLSFNTWLYCANEEGNNWSFDTNAIVFLPVNGFVAHDTTIATIPNVEITFLKVIAFGLIILLLKYKKSILSYETL